MKTLYIDYKKNSYLINNAINVLRNGGIGIFPTDTVYGIGCSALNFFSIKSLFSIKNRDLNKPIAVLVSNIDMVKDIVKNISPIELKLIQNFWPGALTIVFDKSKILPSILTSNMDTIALRMPNNKICLDLINSLGSPIATSSANISNKPPYSKVTKDLLTDFENKVDFIIDSGISDTGVPSTIVKIENNEIKILRQGSISYDNMMEVIKNVK